MRWFADILCITFACVTLLPARLLLAQERDSLEAVWDGGDVGAAMPDETDAADARAGFLLWLREHPYDLNNVAPDELACLPGITAADASAVVAFRGTFGSLSSVEELRLMHGVPGDLLVEKLRPYVRGPEEERRDGTGIGLNARFTALYGRGNEKSLGSPWKSIGRIRMVTDDQMLDAAITYEKDAGEPLRQADVRGGVTFHGPFSWMDALVLGDFAVEGGTGLVLWRGSDLRLREPSPAAMSRRGHGVKTRLAADDLHLFRGGALAWVLDVSSVHLTATHLFSSRMLPGTVDSTGTVTSLFTAGTFTTEKEIAKRDALRERLIGTRIECTHEEAIALGISWYHSAFSRRLREYDDSDRMESIGADWSIRLKGLRVFGEAARSGGGSAWCAGVTCVPEGTVAWGLQYRRSTASFRSFHGQGAGASNEEGVYGCMEVLISRQYILDVAGDLFATPERTGTSPMPVRGSDITLQATGRWNGPIEVTARVRRRAIERCVTIVDPAGRGRRAAVRDAAEHLSLKAVARCARGLTVACRLEGMITHAGSSGALLRGSLLAQTVTWENSFMRIESKMTYFKADAYESRFNLVESPFPGTTSLVLLYGRGWRWSGTARLRLASWCSWSVSTAFGFRDERIDPGKELISALFQKEIGLHFGLNLP